LNLPYHSAASVREKEVISSSSDRHRKRIGRKIDLRRSG